MIEPTIALVERLDFRLVDWQWPFAKDRRADIAAHFIQQQEMTPALWNGRVYMLRNYEISDSVMCGNFFEADFADLLAWRDWGFLDRSIRSCFAMAAIESSDNGFLLGVMGQHTANPGNIYFPTGTPDVHDLFGDRVDLDESVRRELREETGLDLNQFQPQPNWHVVFSNLHVALIKRLRSTENAATIRKRVLDFLASDAQPELADIRILYGHKELTPLVPPYVQAYLKKVWADDCKTNLPQRG